MKSVMTENRSVIVTNPTLYARGLGFDLQVECLSKQDFEVSGFYSGCSSGLLQGVEL
jgi:hypothetical protein